MTARTMIPFTCVTHRSLYTFFGAFVRGEIVVEAATYGCGCHVERNVGRVKPPEFFEQIERRVLRPPP